MIMWYLKLLFRIDYMLAKHASIVGSTHVCRGKINVGATHASSLDW